MKTTCMRIAIAAILVAAMLQQTVGIAARGAITLPISPVSGSGVSGTATITAPGEAAMVTVELGGLEFGHNYPVHLHAGTCAQPSASAGLLGTLVADDSGRGRITSDAVRVSAAGVATNLTLQLLTDGDHIIDVHNAQGGNIAGVVACGSIPGAMGAPPSGAADYAVPNGNFFQESNGLGGAGNTGYTVIDDADAPFWSEFKRLGGVAAIGYPVSRRFWWDGFLVQAFQKVVFQWRPEVGRVYFVNVFDRMAIAGKDAWLESVRSTPHVSDSWADQGLSWNDIVRRHQALLDANEAIKKRYFSDADPLQHFGLPMAYRDYGNVVVVRAQRAVFQQWKEGVPWANAGEVTLANGGDVAKEAGMFPVEAVTPEPGPGAQTGTWNLLVQGDFAPGYSGPLTPGRLAAPNDIAVDGEGNLYVTDMVCGCIQEYSAVGVYLAQWKPPTNSEQPVTLGGPALDRYGNIYVTDALRQRVLKLSPQGQLVAQWKTEKPAGIAVDQQGNVFVAEFDQISKFTPTGQLLARWASSGMRQITSAHHLAVDGRGNIYVSEGYRPPSNGLGGYVGTIVKLSPDGAWLAQWGEWGIKPGQFANPQGIAADANGNIYVADWENGRIQKLSPAGNAVVIDGPTGVAIQFRPKSVAVDRNGNLYALDATNHQILKKLR